MKITTNPEPEFVRNKKKAIRDNGNYCVGCPKTPEWRCKGSHYCKAFTEQKTTGWCAEGLYYKNMEEE